MFEWIRTVILLVLLALGVTVVIWARLGYEANYLERFQSTGASTTESFNETQSR